MGKVKEHFYDEDMNEVTHDEQPIPVYPKKLKVDGYLVNHYHDGDVPVYEIWDGYGNVLEVAHSTNELHEMTQELTSTEKRDE